MKVQNRILHSCTIALSAGLALSAINVQAQRRGGGHGRPPIAPPQRRCVLSGGQRRADVDRVINADGRGTESINVRQKLDLGPECSGVRVKELRVSASAVRDRRGSRGGAEATLVLDGRRTGATQRIQPGQSDDLVFNFPANEDQLGVETRTIEVEIRGKAYVDTIQIVADRARGGFDDDGRVEDVYSNRPILGNRVDVGTTTSVSLVPTKLTIVPSRRDSVLKGLELKALDDDFQIVNLTVYFADRGSDRLDLGRKFLAEGSNTFIDFEGGRFHDTRAVSRIEITGKQVQLFDRRPRLQVNGVEAGRPGPGGPGGPGRGDHGHDGPRRP